MEKLKIGLFIDTFFPMVDGVVNVVDSYAKRLAKTCDVVVFAPKGRKKFNDESLGYKVVRCNKIFRVPFSDYDLALPKFDKNFLKMVEDSHLDIVHIHSPFSIGKTGVDYAVSHNLPCVATMHSQFKRDFKRAIKFESIANKMVDKLMKTFNKCDECWAVNDEVARVFKEYGAKDLPKTQNNGTDFLPVTDFAKVENLRKKYNIKPDEKVLLFVGRLTALKNIFFTAKSLHCLKELGFKFKMIYLGTGPDENRLKQLVKKLKLKNDVIFTGRIPERSDLAYYYYLADLFLFPSLYDASSLVQIEAAAQSTPALFLEGAATTATITPEKNGYIASNSEMEYAKKIMSIFSKNSNYEDVCKNAFKDLYVSWDNAVEKAKNDYLRIIEHKKLIPPSYVNKGQKSFMETKRTHHFKLKRVTHKIHKNIGGKVYKIKHSKSN